MRSHITFQMGVGVLLVAGATSLAIAADTSGDNKDMVLIPKGEFTMGSNEHSDEVRHQVVLDAYLLDKFETSNARYKEFMRATGHPAPAYWDDPRLSKPEQPVVGVSWTDANAFCKWDGKRLPTEAEWEKAAKGPEGDNHYPWGHHLDPKKANYGQNVGRTMPVDSYPDGVSGYGIYNMAGNVFEWVDDWYDPKYYKTSNALNPKGADKGYNFANQGPVKVLRGGSWLAPETSLHTSHRFWNQPENNSYGVGLGFRCAKSVSAVSEEAAQAGRDAFIQALVGMGAEKNADAMASIEKALAADPNNKEYLAMLIARAIRDITKAAISHSQYGPGHGIVSNRPLFNSKFVKKAYNYILLLKNSGLGLDEVFFEETKQILEREGRWVSGYSYLNLIANMISSINQSQLKMINALKRNMNDLKEFNQRRQTFRPDQWNARKKEIAETLKYLEEETAAGSIETSRSLEKSVREFKVHFKRASEMRIHRRVSKYLLRPELETVFKAVEEELMVLEEKIIERGSPDHGLNSFDKIFIETLVGYSPHFYHRYLTARSIGTQEKMRWTLTLMGINPSEENVRIMDSLLEGIDTLSRKEVGKRQSTVITGEDDCVELLTLRSAI